MIREVKTADDVREVARLAEVIWREAYSRILSPEQIDYMIEKFQSIEAVEAQLTSGYRYFLLSADRNIDSGFCGIEIQPDGRMYLSKAYLLAEARGFGLFTELLLFLKDLCRKSQVSIIWLTVNRNNARAIAAYTKNGFKTVREQVADIGHGYVMDDYVMELAV